jgi:hypothetical protein
LTQRQVSSGELSSRADRRAASFRSTSSGQNSAIRSEIFRVPVSTGAPVLVGTGGNAGPVADLAHTIYWSEGTYLYRGRR